MFAPDMLTRDEFLGGRLGILQPKKGYRAGVDPVLLAASVPARAGQSVLELRMMKAGKLRSPAKRPLPIGWRRPRAAFCPADISPPSCTSAVCRNCLRPCHPGSAAWSCSPLRPAWAERLGFSSCGHARVGAGIFASMLPLSCTKEKPMCEMGKATPPSFARCFVRAVPCCPIHPDLSGEWKMAAIPRLHT